MRPRRKKYRAATALVIAVSAGWSVHAAAAAVCPLEIVGTWKSAAAEPRLLSFTSDGWANVLDSAELDILAQVQYTFVPLREPRRIQFQTRRGNDIFPAGSSSWEITAHTDESFSARSSSAADGEQFHWTRIPTQRYFLTFAARGNTTLFVMWTTLDGNSRVFEALGTTTQGTEVRFGRIPQETATAFATPSERAEDAMLRMELSEAEYRRTHQVFVSWDTLVSRNLLAREDPRHQALLLLDATIQNMNRCRLRIRTDGETASSTLPPLDLIRSIRKSNSPARLVPGVVDAAALK